MDDYVDRRLPLQGPCLGQRPGESVEQPVLAPECLQFGGDEIDHDFVWDEVSAVDERLGPPPKFRVVSDVGAQDVPGAHVLGPKVAYDPIGNGTFTRPRGAHDERAHAI